MTEHSASDFRPSAPPAPLVSNIEGAAKSDIDLLLEEEMAELAIAEAEEKKLKEVTAIRERKDQALQNIARLSRQAQGEGARRRTSIQTNIDQLCTANRS